MVRPLFLIAILTLSAGEMQGRTTRAEETEKAGKKAAASSAPKRRALFRTDSPRLFAPSSPKPAERPAAPIAPEASRARAATPAPKPTVAKPRTTAPTPRISPPLLRLQPLPKPATLTDRRDFDLQPTSFTPYDRYLGTVRTVISRVDERPATMATACELVRTGRRFRYVITDPYRAQPPEVTEARNSGDCKSKALWLYDHLGDPGAHFVIGKLDRRSRISHAWVYWRHDGRWWILDPTDRVTPISADSVASHRYVPYYSFSRAGTFRHQATRLLLAGGNGIPVSKGEPAIAVRSRSTPSRPAGRKSEAN